MIDDKNFDIIIIGGSYSGLSAAMALGRALRKTLIIDSGKPCNIQTPHSHNFLTQDGKTPQEITTLAKQQVENYKTVMFYNGLAITANKTEKGFEITTETGAHFSAKKIIFATGIKDVMPDIKGFAACWGISIIHCPYCHGYEYKNEQTGILSNGEIAFEIGKLISNWTKDLTIFTNGKSTLTKEQTKLLTIHNIKIIELKIDYFDNTEGIINRIVFKDKTSIELKALYARPKFDQQSDLPRQLGCEFTDQNYLKTDSFQRTTQEGIYACGDNSSRMRSVSYAVATGGIAGAMLNNELIEEKFN